MNNDTLAVVIAVVGVGLEIFIATLDWWFEIPHLIYNPGSGWYVVKPH